MAKTRGMILGINVNFKIVLLIFSNICCRHASMRQFQCVHTKYVFSINELFNINFLKTDSQLFSLFQHLYDNNRLLFYAFDSLS